MPRTTPASRLAPLLIVLGVLLGATGCGAGSADDAPASRTTPTATPPSAPASTPASGTESAEATDEPAPFASGTRPVDGGYGSGNGLGLTGVRTAHRSGYDRVVFDLDGTGSPGFYVRYAKRPRADGSGDPVRLDGTTYLQVVLRGMGLPSDTGIPPFGNSTTRVPGAGTSRVTEIAPGGTFEGDQLAFVGLSGGRTPFRAFTLTDPTRLVVDVRDE